MKYIDKEGKEIADIEINSNGIIDFSSEPIGSDESYKFSTWLDNDAKNKFLFIKNHKILNLLKQIPYHASWEYI